MFHQAPLSLLADGRSGRRRTAEGSMKGLLGIPLVYGAVRVGAQVRRGLVKETSGSLPG